MTPRDPARLEGHARTPAGSSSAEGALTTNGRSAPKGAAEGVVVALLPDPRPDDGPRIVAVLRLVAPFRGTPWAHAWCACGTWDERATGLRGCKALEARHARHRSVCPLRAPREGRRAS
ncbi:hypothetical protein EF918_12765 [Streptomyces sp. WAC06614]|nr:hypothetical protein EF918_12765 [Streptomyces sp. WAC06614]